MHPIVAALLSVLLVTVVLMVVQFVLAYKVVDDLGLSKDIKQMTAAQIKEAGRSHPAARLVELLHPIAYWWIYLPVVLFVWLRKRG